MTQNCPPHPASNHRPIMLNPLATNPLPEPDKPYRSWSTFYRALWEHGRDNLTLQLASAYPKEAREFLLNILSPYDVSNEDDKTTTLRPSFGLACARQTYFVLKGEQPAPLPPAVKMSFSVGALLHQLSAYFVLSSAPECFAVACEVEVNLAKSIKGWPNDPKRANPTGTADILLSAFPLGFDTWSKRPLMHKDISRRYHKKQEAYLSRKAMQESPIAVIDNKTMSAQQWENLKSGGYEKKPDVYGYERQAVLYSAALAYKLGIEEVVPTTILAGINRNSPVSGLARYTIKEPEKILKDIEHNLAKVNAGEDPGSEMIQRYGSAEVAYFCRSTRAYCAYAKQCMAANH